MKIEIETRKVELAPGEMAELLDRMREPDLRETFRQTRHTHNRIIVDELIKDAVPITNQTKVNLLYAALEAVDHVGQANWAGRQEAARTWLSKVFTGKTDKSLDEIQEEVDNRPVVG